MTGWPVLSRAWERRAREAGLSFIPDARESRPDRDGALAPAWSRAWNMMDGWLMPSAMRCEYTLNE